MGIRIALLVLFAGASGWPALAQEDETEPVEMTDAARVAIGRALEYLRQQQQPNGAWRADVGFKINNGYNTTTANADHVGVTALACMAFMAAGNLPSRGQYGAEVQRGLEFILSCSSREHGQDGFITANGSRMYSHAFAALFLAEIFGMTHDPTVHEALKRAVRFIVVTQNESGGWRYAPGALDSDMSIVVCQVQALRAARNVGLSVPIHTIKKAQEYVRLSARSNGGFLYQTDQHHQSRQSFALAAAGVTALQGTAIYSDLMVERGLQFIESTADTEDYGTYFFYYGHYYAVQAMYIGGIKWPHRWRNWYPRIRGILLKRQDADGRWHSYLNEGSHYRGGPGDSFATAMGALILQIPYRYLPIFQR